MQLLIASALVLGACAGSSREAREPHAPVAWSRSETHAKESVVPQPSRPTPAAGPMEPTRALAGAAQCRAGDAVELGTSTVRTLRPQLAFQPDGDGLVAWPTGEDTLQLRAVRTSGLGPVVEGELDQAIGLGVLGATERGYIAVTAVPLCGNGQGNACLRARGFDGAGSPTGPAFEPEARDQLATITARTAVPGGVALGLAFRYATSISILRLGESGAIELEPHPLRGDCVGEAPIGHLASDRGTVVALGSSDCSAPPRFLLALGGRRQAVRTLPADAEIIRFTSDGGVATIVFRTPRLRPRAVRLTTTDGAVLEGPTVLETAADLAPDLAGVVVPELTVARRQLVLRRADLSGAAVGEPYVVAPATGRPLTRLVWTGRDFAVLWATRSGRTWHLFLRRVACAT